MPLGSSIVFTTEQFLKYDLVRTFAVHCRQNCWGDKPSVRKRNHMRAELRLFFSQIYSQVTNVIILSPWTHGGFFPTLPFSHAGSSCLCLKFSCCSSTNQSVNQTLPKCHISFGMCDSIHPIFWIILLGWGSIHSSCICLPKKMWNANSELHFKHFIHFRCFSISFLLQAGTLAIV